MKSLINKDLANGIMPKWHDESYWNFVVNDYHKKEFYKLHLLNSSYLCPSKYKNKSSKIIQLNKLTDFNFQDKQNQLNILTLIKFILIKIKIKLIQ